MKIPVYAVQDVLIGFIAPFTIQNDNIAIREYTNSEKNDPNSKDKRLFKIGEFDDETGELTPCTPNCICGGIEHE